MPINNDEIKSKCYYNIKFGKGGQRDFIWIAAGGFSEGVNSNIESAVRVAVLP